MDTMTIELTPDNVSEDNNLSQAEKETNIWFDKTTDKAFVHTSEGGIMRRLLQHPEFEVTDYHENEGNIVSIKGLFPIAALSFGSKPRKQKGHANIVTNGVMGGEDNAKIAIND